MLRAIELTIETLGPIAKQLSDLPEVRFAPDPIALMQHFNDISLASDEVRAALLLEACDWDERVIDPTAHDLGFGSHSLFRSAVPAPCRRVARAARTIGGTVDALSAGSGGVSAPRRSRASTAGKACVGFRHATLSPNIVAW